MSIHVFGIRHHGPGCARSLRTALDELQPDALVIEAPADAEDVLHLAARDDMQPPVALLIYPADEPREAVYYPFTDFSPEWQALRWALSRNIPVRLMDLPQSNQMALERERRQQLAIENYPAAEEGAEESLRPADAEAQHHVTQRQDVFREDPLAMLAEAAGYKDHELWWEQQIERRENVSGLFDAILAAMRVVRDSVSAVANRDLLREAHMRKALRETAKQGFARIAVVCGAFHAPVLDEAAAAGHAPGCRFKDDNEALRGLPKLKTAATWIPWTHSRLSYRSGYGAGVQSPGWYAHVWKTPEQAPLRWITTAARLLRTKDLDASSASVIETVRLADALAAMRDLRSPGLEELNESILTVLCHGDPLPMRLIRDRLEIGDELGAVAADTPSLPLQQDLQALLKRVRLKQSPEIRTLDLDLRKENDLARSHLLHQLGLLNIGWGDLRKSGGQASTFHELWQLQWQPDFTVKIIEASVWGNTVSAAASSKLIHDAEQSVELPKMTALLDAAMLSGLTKAVDPLLARIQSQAAVSADVRHLLDSLLPLAKVARYGDVRGASAAHVEPILAGLFERATVGLPSACSALDEAAAEWMLGSIGQAQQALDVLDRVDLRDEWQQLLRVLMASDIHALLRGWCSRLLFEKQALGEEELYLAARLALSSANPPAECAAWAAGLLRGSGLLLLYQDGVWQVFNRWLSELSAETFVELLPLLRKAFADFAPAERRQMGEKVKHLSPTAGKVSRPREAPAAEVHWARARLALPVLAHILGVPYDDNHR
jgi:uncharacterized protein DUF5682